MAKVKVGIIGCGAIGSFLAKILCKNFKNKAELAFLCDLHAEKVLRLQKELRRKTALVSIDQLIRRSDLVMEAAAASISGYVATRALKFHKSVLIMSVGGLLSVRGLFKLTTLSRGRLWIPSGAIVGVDGVLAAWEAGIRKLKLITKKPPAGLREAPYFQKRKFPKLKNQKPVRLFKGSAKEAVKAFPQNINVAAILSLAGIGPLRTQVEIWTSTAYRFNQHEVLVEGQSGKMHAVTQNVPSRENPKTSALAVYSAAALLRKIFTQIHVGS